MMKFFRRYMKHMLAVFMALLLIVWLGGDALTSMIGRANSYGDFVIGHAYGKPVKAADLATLSHQEDIGSKLVYTWYAPWFGILGQMVNDPQFFQYLQSQGRDRLTPEEWYLLDLEARRSGVHVSQAEVNDRKAALPAEMLNAVRDQLKLSVRQIDEALQAYLRIEESALQAMNAVTVSEPDIRQFVRDTGEKIDIDLVMVDPQKLIDAGYEPTQEELQAHFDKYKDLAPGGLSQYGYQLPEATQLEFIQISVDELAKTQVVADDEAFDHWTRNKGEFKRPATQPASTMPAVAPEQGKPYETFTEAKPKVIEKLSRDRAVLAANRLATDLIRQLSRPWADQPTTQPGDFKQPPESEMADDVYEKLIAAYQERYPGVLSYGRTELAGAQELSMHPKVGMTRAFATGSDSVWLSQAAFLIPGSQTLETRTASGARLVRNLFETAAEPLSDFAGNVYVIRNVAFRPAQPPASIDEVRETLVRDLRTIRAGEQAQEVAADLADKAKTAGLKTAFQSDAELAAKLENSAFMDIEPFARQMIVPTGGMPRMRAGQVPGIGYDPALVDMAFSMAQSQTATQPTNVATHQDSRGRWMVVEYKRTLPVTQEEYDQLRIGSRRYLLTQKRIGFVLDWFSSESIHARAGWKAAEEPAPAEQKAEKEEASQARS